jgi:hypothetical protein
MMNSPLEFPTGKPAERQHYITEPQSLPVDEG